MKALNVAIVGATGAVGEELIKILQERRFPVGELRLLASRRSAGRRVKVGSDEIEVQAASADAFRGIDVAFFSAGGSVSKALAPEAVKAGAVVIDNTSAFRMDPSVPLVVPEVNPQAALKHQGIIANPNCSTIIMLVALNPLHQAARVRRVVVSTYQAVSGAGMKAMEELLQQVRDYAAGRQSEARVLPVAALDRHYPILFNVIPQVDVFDEAGYTREEWKMVRETHKIFGDSTIGITATTVRVPVLRSHAESIYIETERRLTVEEARSLLSEAPGVAVMDDPAQQLYPMPLDAAGRDEVFVGRIRPDLAVENGLNLWAVGDQIRKGAALNAIQIAEYLLSEGALG
ncbi:MAG: aspartate-semialdehyde dehydrogenase [Firmicutes bacterium ZCTH02-B6]|nr:MAG: aspartate-semialdehyde dehydrogenase [Firmicutes bacterium ZCTH02-B6]